MDRRPSIVLVFNAIADPRVELTRRFLDERIASYERVLRDLERSELVVIEMSYGIVQDATEGDDTAATGTAET